MIRKQIKTLLGWLVYGSGLAFLLRTYNNLIGKRLTILTFHRVSDITKSPGLNGLPTLYLQIEAFENLIKFLKRAYTILSLHEVLDLIEQNRPLPWNCLVITFDDGYADVYTNAFQILFKNRIPATIFVPTAMIGSEQTFWWDEYSFFLQMCNGKNGRNQFATDVNDIVLEQQNHTEPKRRPFDDLSVEPAVWADYTRHNRLMNWEEIHEMSRSGIEFGSHTRTHVFLTAISPRQSVFEITDSKGELEEHLNCPVLTFCYPGGKASHEIKERVRAAGYRCAVSTRGGINSNKTDLFSLKRINIWDGTVLNSRGRFSPALFTLHWLRSQIVTLF